MNGNVREYRSKRYPDSKNKHSITTLASTHLSLDYITAKIKHAFVDLQPPGPSACIEQKRRLPMQQISRRSTHNANQQLKPLFQTDSTEPSTRLWRLACLKETISSRSISAFRGRFAYWQQRVSSIDCFVAATGFRIAFTLIMAM